MRRSQLITNFIIMIVCFILDSSIAYFLPYNLTKLGVTFIPSLGLMMFILLCKTLQDRYERFFFATICGFYYAITYTNSMLIFILIYTVIAFARTYVVYEEPLSLMTYMLFAAIVLGFKEIVIYFFLRTIQMTYLSMRMYVLLRFLPTVLINLLFAPVIYLTYNWFEFEVKPNEFDKRELI
ncbi:MAG: hypothetical protein J6P61_04240 [Erysipelotrichaceae bacterium]|nr:hypothetical protein [Erysipelotrichaceae bacterium]